jgi:hypothetical protein
MTTFTIDIPDNDTDEVLAQLKKLGVKIRQSKLSDLDKLTKEDYENHFSNRSKFTVHCAGLLKFSHHKFTKFALANQAFVKLAI